MSDYGFDFDDDANGVGQNTPPAGAAPKWFRDYMDSAKQQNEALRAEVKALRAEQAKAELEAKFKAAGIAPGATALYGGEPDKVDEWLTANKDHLAKLPQAPGEGTEEGTPAGPPASTVPPDGQAQMQQMLQAGTQDVAPPQGSEKELEAAIRATKTPEELAQLMQAHGSRYDWTT